MTEFGQVLPLAVAEPGPIQLPYPYPNPYGSVVDMPFDVTLPNPVPAAGVQFVATPPPGSVGTFTAVGGPIAFDIAQINLSLTEFGDSFGLFCTAFPNDTEPTGITASAPTGPQVEPVIVTGDATITPPPPVGPGGVGPYELYCPGTPVGNVVLNDVTTSATLSPAAPAPGDQFSVTGYQVQVPLPASIASAAAALGNTTLAGNASTTIDAAGASPSSISTGALTFDVPLPQPVPASGVTLTVPSTPDTMGPFTASSSAITIAQNADISLVLVISGSNLNLSCTAYPDDSAPTRHRHRAARHVTDLAGDRDRGPAHDPPDDADGAPDHPRHRAPRAAHRPLRAVLPRHPGGQHRPQRRHHGGDDPRRS